MLKNYFDGLLSTFTILSITLLVTGNIARFICWVKRHKSKKEIGIQHYYLWENEWGSECTKEEIEKLKQIIHQFKEKHKDEKIGNKYF